MVGIGGAGCTDEEAFPPGPPSTDVGSSNTATSTATSGSDGGPSTAETSTAGGTSTTVRPAPVAFRLKDLDPSKLTGNFAQCPDCHALLDQPGSVGPALVPSFAHGFHIEAGAECGDCHVSPTHTEEGIRKPSMTMCFGCHSVSDASAPPGACDACHPADFPLEPSSHLKPEWLPVAEQRDEIQGQHTKPESRETEDCTICHDEPEFCDDCHKVEMPHPENWTEAHQPVAKEVGGAACNFRHPDRQVCAECHHKGYVPGGKPWVEMHYEVANAEGKDKCISCHSVKTCAHCHVTGEYKEYD